MTGSAWVGRVGISLSYAVTSYQLSCPRESVSVFAHLTFKKGGLFHLLAPSSPHQTPIFRPAMNSPPATDPSAIPSKGSSHSSRDDSSITLEVPAADCKPQVPTHQTRWATQKAVAPFSYATLPLEAYLMDKNDHERRLLRLSLSSQLSKPNETQGQDKKGDYDEEEPPELESATSSSEYIKNEDDDDEKQEKEGTKTQASDPYPIKQTLKPSAGRDSVLSDVIVPGGPLAARHLPLHRELQEAGLA
ncbi:hypothetical protein L249_0677 [Ophiocordyceps polyrhachis-furcata BCC 54312]|uniref:Uncharacterized protein n=1 Tax=Ophiocordyceps polyrhachis-furcata BCC 54312 TaxID=1330021 RepID=A0A367LC72_9HYPO|nr:hypothetical protein L249_0677 [Ophiocordyceps polyrhachis-furcata BCC 54312]